MEKRRIKKNEITRIKYCETVTIYYTADTYYLCVIGSEEDFGDYLWVTLSVKGKSGK